MNVTTIPVGVAYSSDDEVVVFVSGWPSRSLVPLVGDCSRDSVWLAVDSAWASSACSRSGGSFFPRLLALLKMPEAAWAVK
jgi:hypothetical protein